VGQDWTPIHKRFTRALVPFLSRQEVDALLAAPDLCGAQHYSEMAGCGRAKIEFLKRFLKLKHGVPSHDTFSILFRMLDPKALDAAFGRLMAALAAALAKGGVIAIDGKALEKAYEKGRQKLTEK
jgi:hypothetical protein